jgi:Tol biopolymer transport system component
MTTPPDTIAHYKIGSKLGEGGMGAVYRATDTKLNREVAIKFLPDALARDPDYLARFIREAQVLASLNHPNIAIIHGVEEKALVMELVPGQSLDERIAAGPIPLDEALGIARQIAEALEAAHEKGVIHRDLKPANVMVTPEGVVKVLDFGLAKAADPVSVSNANSPTLTLRATQAGLIMGTAGYMAPEQAAGKPVDRRADIWSFGVVLYELLTGKRLFTGETVSHTLASVLKDRIDFGIPQAPPPIRRLLARCLNRDPKERLRDIGEARIAIRDYLANPAAEAEPITSEPAGGKPTAARGWGHWLPRIISAILFLALAAAVAWILKPPQALPITRFPITLGENQAFTTFGRLSLAISPDGKQMVYVANRRLYLRSMAELEARPIPGTDSDAAVANPVFSPDGKSLAFYDAFSLTLRRIPVNGGTAVTICPVGNVTGASWSDDGIVFAAMGKGILRVSPNGGQPEPLVIPRDNEVVSDPQMLPGGHSVLFTLWALDSIRSARWDKGQIAVQTLKSGVRKILVSGGTSGRYLPTGHLVYVLNGVLLAIPFNLRRLETTGSAVGIVEGVARQGGTAYFAYSNTGSLIYVPGPVTASGTGQNVLALVDRKGEVEPLKVPPGAYGFPRASRDGKQIAYQIDDGKESSIWIYELAGGTAPRRLTLPGTGANRYPIWSSDNQRVAFQSDREGDFAVWWQRADGDGAAERLTKPDKGVTHIPDSWSPDGQTFSFTEEKNNTSAIWTYSLREKKVTLFAATPGASLGKSVFSPDGRWVAYQLGAMPNSRIYVRPFPPTATAYVAPEDRDSHHPVWSPDGKELFYVAGSSQSGSMSIRTQPSVSFGHPVRAPKSGFATQIPASVRTFDILADGKHFIGVVPAGQTQPGSAGAPQIQVVLNWFEDVKQRAPGD